MGLFSNIKREMYINKLVTTFKLYYNCGDMAAIECMRKNYTAKELKVIMNDIKKFAGGKFVSISQIQELAPFKEEISEVSEINMKHGGN